MDSREEREEESCLMNNSEIRVKLKKKMMARKERKQKEEITLFRDHSR